jgi:membrane-bound serine protease (ClpP class)
MREEMASTAEKTGRSKEIARGMVDEELTFTHLLLNGDSLMVNDIEGRKEGKLISLTTEQAIKYKIADGKAGTITELIEVLGYSESEIIENRENWSEKIVRFLTDPVVASLLTTFGFLGILFELQSPGWGIPGIVGLICLVLSLSASYIAQLATMSDMLFIITGLGLIMLEAFIIPGFGIVGISGIGVMLYGLYLLLIPDIPVGEEVLGQAMDGFLIGLIGAVIGLYLLIRVLLKTNFWKQLTSPENQIKERVDKNLLDWESFIGEVGSSETDLHPSGWVKIKGKRVFVVSEGDFVEKGEDVKVLSADGNRILVRKL